MIEWGFGTKKLKETRKFTEGNFSFRISEAFEILDLSYGNQVIISKISFSDSFSQKLEKNFQTAFPSADLSYFPSLQKSNQFSIEYKAKRKKLEVFANCKINKLKDFLNIHFNVLFNDEGLTIENINSSSSKIFWGLQTIINLPDKKGKTTISKPNFSTQKNLKLDNRANYFLVKNNKRKFTLETTFMESSYKNNVLSLSHLTKNLDKKSVKKWIIKNNNANYNVINLKRT